MRSADPKLHNFAQRLLALEARSGQVGETGESAAFRVVEKLREPLSLLAGAAGFAALLSRALALASGEVRWLKGVRAGANGSLEGFEDMRGQVTPDQIAEGEAVLIAQLVRLLVTFIGEVLTARLLQEVWPEISVRDLNSDMETDNG